MMKGVWKGLPVIRHPFATPPLIIQRYAYTPDSLLIDDGGKSQLQPRSPQP
jgi:hypothetical protein